MPPHTFQIRVRVERTKALIRVGAPLVHAEAGFADQSHFIRHFKKTLGITPGQYAEMIKKPVVSI